MNAKQPITLNTTEQTQIETSEELVELTLDEMSYVAGGRQFLKIAVAALGKQFSR